MKVYLAGPMSNLPGYNYAAFDKAAAKLRAAGHKVFSPADNDRAKGYSDRVKATMATGGAAPQDVKRACMGDDLAYICEQAEAIAFLPGWDGSSIPPVVEANPVGLSGLKCTWTAAGVYQCTWAGSAGAKIEAALAKWLGLIELEIPRDWIV